MNKSFQKGILLIACGIVFLFSFQMAFAAELDPSSYSNSIETTSNVSSVTPAAIKGELKAVVKGNTIVNLMGSDGDCESTSGWTANASATLDLNSTYKVFGSNSIKFTLAGASGGFYKNVISQIDTTKYYLFTGHVRNGNTTDGVKLTTYCNGTGAINKTSSKNTSTNWQRYGLVFQPSDFGTGATAFEIYVYAATSSAGQYAYGDGIQLQEITSTEYALGATALLDKYSFINDLKHTDLTIIKSVGKNLFSGYMVSGSIDGSGNDDDSNTARTRSNDFKLYSENKNICISNSNGYSFVRIVAYDSNKTKISEVTNGTATPYGTKYVKFCLNGSNNNNNVQIEVNTTSTTYEPYTETTAYVPVSLKSISSNVCDTFEPGTGVYTKNVSDMISLWGNNFTWNFSYDYIGYKTVYTAAFTGGIRGACGDKAILYKYNNKKLTENWSTITQADMYQSDDTAIYPSIADGDSGWLDAWNGSTTFTGMTWPDLIKAYMYGWKLTTVNTDVTNCVWTGISSGTTKSGAAGLAYVTTNIDNGYTPYRMMYQIANPITKRYAKQPLISQSGGMILTEAAVKELEFYKAGITIKDSTKPIKSILSVSKFDGGIETPIALTNVNVATDGKSLTITGAVDGEVYEYKYSYSSELSSIPTIKYSVPLNKSAQVDDNTALISKLIAKVTLLEDNFESFKTQVNNTVKINSTPIKLNSAVNKSMDVSLTALNIRDFSQVSFTLIYNPAELDVVDLCSNTTAADLTTGFITGSDVTITSFTPGTIKFTVNKPINAGKSWAGVVNSIEFKGKVSGVSTLSYTVE